MKTKTKMEISSAREILKHKFGFDAFRMNQEAAIGTLLEGRDAVVLMPTGGGKSLCYQIPAMMFEGLTLVISPLIALMKDQVDALNGNGVPAAYLNSTQTSREQVRVFHQIRNGELKLLYVAPERLLSTGEEFKEFLRGTNISLVAIDEAHCISSWGHDFRPEYRRLSLLKELFPEVPLIALTATADKLVRADIIKYLRLEDYELLVSSFNRPNIYYTVTPKRNSYDRLLEFLGERRDESGIIYCLSRTMTEKLAADLQAEGYEALPYHAGLTKDERDRNQTRFINDEVKIVVATIAFGMGIDKSNVRFVVHMDLPKNIESYYQETGRAGRDGLESDALLFFSWGDVIKLKGFVEVENNERQSEIMLKKLNRMGEYGELKTCRRKYLLKYFDEELEDDCGACDNCNTVFEKIDGTVIAQKALSAVARTGQQFGLTYLVDFLRGSKSQKIRESHKRLKTYGIGAEYTKDEWYAYFKDLVSQGYLAQTEGRYPTICFTEKSLDALRGDVRIELFKVKPKKEKTASLVSDVSHPYEKELFERLRDLRAGFARDENVPPYVIFSDATLVEMATYLPQTREDLLRISGVGDLKLEKYGADFIGGIVDFCEETGNETRMDLKEPVRGARSRKRKKKKSDEDTYRKTLTMFREGRSVSEIARTRGLAESTIENHLIRFIRTGEVRAGELVAPEKIERIREAVFELDPGGGLSPIKEYLGDDVSYGEIRAVVAEMA